MHPRYCVRDHNVCLCNDQWNVHVAKSISLRTICFPSHNHARLPQVVGGHAHFLEDGKWEAVFNFTIMAADALFPTWLKACCRKRHLRRCVAYLWAAVYEQRIRSVCKYGLWPLTNSWAWHIGQNMWRSPLGALCSHFSVNFRSYDPGQNDAVGSICRANRQMELPASYSWTNRISPLAFEWWSEFSKKKLLTNKKNSQN